ncbi:MAG: inorganic phosphate transporter [Melioribacteraceae bacterium]|jgi:phosphate/sulfate permease|nr:inorganic phosphate transporter [Melioribacteraceae bacterium]RJP56630.1 MAG: inorganic phosphate transporter [Ignavibacteriales bacterium]WKZ68837.1 MAG: inorganic phosphate transporter [Melioribacteraceae bacterium]
MDLYLIIVIVLFVLAVSDLVVGVSNDAVNFLNSAIGSRVAPRHIILIIASLGILVGTTFSSGIMEVARKGIFNPEMFLFSDIMVVFLAVMITDVLLLDLFNTFSLPTSTTVSIVFELLGASVAVASIKVIQLDGGIDQMIAFINTSKALAIISGILLSVVISFTVGALIQYLIRLLFTFNYSKKLKVFGGLWGGFALSFILYFILVKGAKGSSFLNAEQSKWILDHSFQIISISFVTFGIIFQFLAMFTKVNIFKPIVLVGTFALALAFAANDLVNFIGVPLAGFSSYLIAQASADPSSLLMEALREPVTTETVLLLAAGIIMVVTLWFSKKAQSVTKTEVNLGRQFEGFERFESSLLSRVIVRMGLSLGDGIKKMLPQSLLKMINRRMDKSKYFEEKSKDGEVPSFDLLRASVNLMVASVLISFATSLKLPLSTTYVTFMVAMGTSFSDKSWGRESAVYRINGVLTVIGGWFFTAFMAFTASALFATAIYFGGMIVTAIMLGIAAYIIFRTHILHKLRSAEEDENEKSLAEEDKTGEDAIIKCVTKTQKYLDAVGKTVANSFDGLAAGDRDKLKKTKKEAKKIRKLADSITSNIFKTIQILEEHEINENHRFGKIIASIQEISNNVTSLVGRSFGHIDNNHNKPVKEQLTELFEIEKLLSQQIDVTITSLSIDKEFNSEKIEESIKELKKSLKKFDKNQFSRIKKKATSTRSSMLFISLLGDAENISEQINTLAIMCNDTTKPLIKDGVKEKPDVKKA